MMLLEREHCEPVLVGVPGHLDDGSVARGELGALHSGLDAVEAGHGERHGAEPMRTADQPAGGPPAPIVDSTALPTWTSRARNREVRRAAGRRAGLHSCPPG